MPRRDARAQSGEQVSENQPYRKPKPAHTNIVVLVRSGGNGMPNDRASYPKIAPCDVRVGFPFSRKRFASCSASSSALYLSLHDFFVRFRILLVSNLGSETCLRESGSIESHGDSAKGKCMYIKSGDKPVLRSLIWLLALAVGAGSWFSVPTWAQDQPDQSDQAQQQPLPEAPPPNAPSNAPLSPDQLQQLVAPIALYPDALVAQILAAAAYPTQIVEAERFMQQNPDLHGKDLGDAVNQQDWDPSVKALTQFPTVLANLDKNLSWTSELGDANYNQQAEVSQAIQFMRKKAQDAGHLQSTPQQTVTDQGDDVDIQPANPDVVYVPVYNPDLIYGYPVGLWPGFYPWWGIGGPYLSFGVGFGIGPFFGFGWGWPAWGFNWHGGFIRYGGGPYAFHSHAFYDRNAYFHGNYRGFAPYARGDRGARGFAPAGRGFENRGSGGARGVPGRAYSAPRAGAFGGISRGGEARGYAARGRASLGGGGHFGGGGGGGHAGGGRR